MKIFVCGMVFSWGFSIVMFVACWSVVFFSFESESKSEFKHFLSHDFEPKLSKTTTNFRGRTHPQNSLIMFSTSILGFRNSICEYLYHHFWIGRRFSGIWSLDRQLFLNLPPNRNRNPNSKEMTRTWKTYKNRTQRTLLLMGKGLVLGGVDLSISIHFTV